MSGSYLLPFWWNTTLSAHNACERRHACAGCIAVHCRSSAGQAPSPGPSHCYTRTGKDLRRHSHLMLLLRKNLGGAVFKGQERGSHLSSAALFSIKVLPFCTHKCQSPGQSIHISPGTHSTSHTEDRILAIKQWNLSLPLSPNILIVIKSIDEHYRWLSITLRENAGTVSLFWALRELVTRKALCSERFLVVIETTPLTTPFSWGGGISTVLLDWLNHGSSSPFLM